MPLPSPLPFWTRALRGSRPDLARVMVARFGGVA
jgi:hypothetical protein